MGLGPLNAMVRHGMLICGGLLLAAFAHAGARPSQQALDSAETGTEITGRYADHSDAELTALAADWDDLDADQRRALLAEVKLRMVRQKTRNDTIHVKTLRRYGRLIRQPDGSVLRIERKVLSVRELDAADLERLRAGALQRTGGDDEAPGPGFGVGFERRHRILEGPAAPASDDSPADDAPPLPVLRAKSPHR